MWQPPQHPQPPPLHASCAGPCVAMCCAGDSAAQVARAHAVLAFLVAFISSRAARLRPEIPTRVVRSHCVLVLRSQLLMLHRFRVFSWVVFARILVSGHSSLSMFSRCTAPAPQPQHPMHTPHILQRAFHPCTTDSPPLFDQHSADIPPTLHNTSNTHSSPSSIRYPLRSTAPASIHVARWCCSHAWLTMARSSCMPHTLRHCNIGLAPMMHGRRTIVNITHNVLLHCAATIHSCTVHPLWQARPSMSAIVFHTNNQCTTHPYHHQCM